MNVINTAGLVATIGDTQLSRANVVSLDISLGSYPHIQEAIIAAARRGESRSVCFANAHMVVEAARNTDFAQAVNGADWVAADGVPLTWALRGLHGRRQDRVAGMDMLPDLLQRAADEDLPVYFYGSTPDVLKRTTLLCRQRFPQLTIAGSMSPPFRPLTAAEEDNVVATIRQSGAKLVFVALGCPKQEQWMARMRHRVPAVLLGIGGALPVLAGVQDRAPEWLRRAGLEWTYRLALEPRRLFKRYFVTNSLFIYYVLRRAFAA